MMREIKFRAWDKDQEQMHADIQDADGQPDYIGYDTNNNMVIFQPASFYDYLFNNRFKIMQYTGLKDINGVEIYEGDIVAKNLSDELGYIAFLPQEMGYVIVYKKRDERLGHRNTASQYESDSRLARVGNIYENPELLEGAE